MIGSRGSSADLILIARTSPHWCECNQLALALVPGRFWRALGPVLEPSRSSGGCCEAAGSAYIGSQRAAGVVWNMAGVVSKRFREGLGGHGDPLWAILEPFQTLPGAPGGHWEMLGGAGSTKIVVWRLPGAIGSTKIMFWRLPGAVGSTKLVVLVAPGARRRAPRWPATAIRNPPKTPFSI